MTMQTATETQLTEIRRHAVNDTTRAIAASGVLLTHEQADDLGEETLAWLTSRLGLRVTETDRGVECEPRTYIAVADQHVGTCEALRWAALSIRPFVLATGTDEDDVRERAIEAVGHDAVTLHVVGA
jgi:hypothetical protein